MKKILFVNQENSQCGVYQFGKNSAYILSKFSDIHKFDYLETATPYEFTNEYDLVIFNHHPVTMGWFSSEYLKKKTCKTAILIHDEATSYNGCDGYLYPDPTFTSNTKDKNFNVGRPILNFISNEKVIPNSIGSFGFGFSNKCYDKIIHLASNEFEESIVRIHIPLNTKVDPTGTYAYSMSKKLLSINKPNVKLEITHDYKNETDLLKWLSQNTINAFLYDSHNMSIGCSSTIDWAIAAKRPIALSDDQMFRHMKCFAPDTILKNTIRSIMNMDLKPLEYVHKNWTEIKFYENYCGVIDEILRSSW